MNKLTISTFGNKIFPEIINEIKLFSEIKVKYYENLNLCIDEVNEENHLLVFFVTDLNKNYLSMIKIKNLPIILIFEPSVERNLISGELIEKLNMPFTISDFNKRIISYMKCIVKHKSHKTMNL